MAAFQPESEALREWLDGVPGDPEAPEVGPAMVWLHLDGIIDSASALLTGVRRVLETSPGWDPLETFLIEAQIQVDHLNQHWTELLNMPGMDWLKDLVSDQLADE